jgi:hypothetical protein
MLKYQISLQSAPWEPKCSNQMDRETDVMKLTVVFCNFANVPKKQMHDAVVAKSGTVQSVHILKIQCRVLQSAKKFN